MSYASAHGYATSRGRRRSGSRDVQRAGRVRAAEPLLRADRVEVGGRPRPPRSPRPTARRRPAPAPRSPRAARARGRPSRRSTRRPTVAISRVRGVTCARIRSKTSAAGALAHPRDAERRARAPSSGPVSPKCSASVVTTSSPGAEARARRRRPARPASSTRSARSARPARRPARRAARARASRRASISSKYALPRAPVLDLPGAQRRPSRRASRARAARTCRRSDTRAARAPGKRARSSAQLIRHLHLHGRMIRQEHARRACALRVGPALAPAAALAPRTRMWSMPGPAGEKPHSSAASVAQRRRSSARHVEVAGEDDDVVRPRRSTSRTHAARSSSASASRRSGG